MDLYSDRFFKIHGLLYKSIFSEFMDYYISPSFQNLWITIQVHLFRIYGLLYKSTFSEIMEHYKIHLFRNHGLLYKSRIFKSMDFYIVSAD